MKKRREGEKEKRKKKSKDAEGNNNRHSEGCARNSKNKDKEDGSGWKKIKISSTKSNFLILPLFKSYSRKVRIPKRVQLSSLINSKL